MRGETGHEEVSAIERGMGEGECEADRAERGEWDGFGDLKSTCETRGAVKVSGTTTWQAGERTWGRAVSAGG